MEALLAGVAQLVEHQLPKLRVASSSLVSRSRSPGKTFRGFFLDSRDRQHGCLVVRAGADGAQEGHVPSPLFRSKTSRTLRVSNAGVIGF